MKRNLALTTTLLALTAALAGCQSTASNLDSATVDAVDAAANRAVQVAEQIGGVDGFGGALASACLGPGGFMPPFAGPADLADSSGVLTVRCTNLAGERAAFHLAYFASHLGWGDQSLDLEVAAGSTVDVQIPCAEIVGLGPLTAPGGYGCQLASGGRVNNRFAIPGFLNRDYACGGVWACTLLADADDVDGDGDTAEPIVFSDGLLDWLHSPAGAAYHHGPHSGAPGEFHHGAAMDCR